MTAADNRPQVTMIRVIQGRAANGSSARSPGTSKRISEEDPGAPAEHCRGETEMLCICFAAEHPPGSRRAGSARRNRRHIGGAAAAAGNPADDRIRAGREPRVRDPDFLGRTFRAGESDASASSACSGAAAWTPTEVAGFYTQVGRKRIRGRVSARPG